MIKKISIYTILIFALSVFNEAKAAIDYESFNYPARPSARLGVGSTPEKNYVEKKALSSKSETKKATIDASKTNTAVTYADLSLRQISKDIIDDMDIDSPKMLSDLSILYGSAVQKSETIKYAIYKLSNPEESKPSESAIKRILKPIASFSTIAGTALSANPYMAGGALIGGGLMNAFSSDDNEINYKFTKVNDADMVLLVRKIDDLQKRLVTVYMNYTTQKEMLKLAMDNLENRRKVYNSMKNSSREQVIIADTYYRNAQDFVKKTKSEYDLARVILENMAGKEALETIEKDDKITFN